MGGGGWGVAPVVLKNTLILKTNLLSEQQPELLEDEEKQYTRLID